MSQAALWIGAKCLPEGDFSGQAAIWQGRDAPQGVLCLEIMLEERLVDLRTLHGQWVYEQGLRNGLAKNLCCGQTPSMWWTSLVYERHPRLSPHLYPMYKLACVELWLKEINATALTVHGGSEKLRASIGQICKDMGIACELAGGPEEKQERPAGLRRLYKAIPAPFRAIIRLVYWLFTVRRLLPTCRELLQGSVKGQKSAIIATYFPNIDMALAAKGKFRSHYWESLHDALEEQARAEGQEFVRWLFVHFPAPGLSLAECIALRDKFVAAGGNGLSLNYLEEFLTPGDLWQAVKRWFRLCAASLRAEKDFAENCVTKGSAFNFWPWLKAEWAESMRGWRSLERCLFNLAFERYCRMAGPQRWTLFALENCPWERMLTEAARRVYGNGPVFGAQHSTIRPTDFRYFDARETFTNPDCAAFQPDIIAGNGQSAVSQWRRNGMPSDRLRQVEALRYLYLAKKIKEWRNPAMLAASTSPPHRLLMATSFFVDETDFMLRLVAQALAAGLLDKFELVLKPHPYLLPTRWLDGLPPEFAAKLAVSARPIGEELMPGTAVWAANSTTVALEAALLGLPLMVMAASDDFDLCPIQDAKGLLRTATLADVKSCLEKLAPPELAPDYLDLNENLPAWSQLLGLGIARF